MLLKGILLPFVAGMAIAYLLDPVCDRLEAMGTSRTLATTIVTAIFAVIVILLLLLIVPLAIQQTVDFLSSLPDFIARTHDRLLPFLTQLQQRFDLPDAAELNAIAPHAAGIGADMACGPAGRRRGAGAGARQPAVADLHHAGRCVLSAARLGQAGRAAR